MHTNEPNQATCQQCAPIERPQDTHGGDGHHDDSDGGKESHARPAEHKHDRTRQPHRKKHGAEGTAGYLGVCNCQHPVWGRRNDSLVWELLGLHVEEQRVTLQRSVHSSVVLICGQTPSSTLPNPGVEGIEEHILKRNT
jgi:hypothetical protein